MSMQTGRRYSVCVCCFMLSDRVGGALSGVSDYRHSMSVSVKSNESTGSDLHYTDFYDFDGKKIG